MNFEVELNPHVVNLKESATLKVNQLARGLRSAGEEVYHFGFGQSPFPVHKNIVQQMERYAGEKDYLPTLGLMSLRVQITEYYRDKFGYSFDPERIIVGPGSKEMIFQALYALEGPVIVPAPSWVSYGPQVNIRGKDIVEAVTKEENKYKLQPDELEKACSGLGSGQKVLILNSPSNPTGQVYNDEEIEALSKVCRKHKVVVISDEIYAMIDFTGVKKKGFCHYYPEGTIVTAGLSKSHSAGGYRLGFMAVPESMHPLIGALKSLVSETFSSVSAPTQYAAVAAYSNDLEIEDYLHACAVVHEHVGLYIWGRLVDMGASCPKPEGSFYVFPNFEKFRDGLTAKFEVKTSTDLSRVCLEQSRVAFLPGSDFYMPLDHLSARMATVDYDGGEVVKAALGKNLNLNESFVESHCRMIVSGLDSLDNFLNS